MHFIVKALENCIIEKKNHSNFPYLYRQSPLRCGIKHLEISGAFKICSRLALCSLGDYLQHGKVLIYTLRKMEANGITISF